MIELAPAPATLPPDRRVYAVGDIHGCLDQLRALHAAIAADLAARPIRHASLIHLGDLIDRGPDSAQVVRHLASGTAPAGITETVTLRGNHEAMMLAAIEAPETDGAARLWILNGGADALLSWGVPRQTEPQDWGARLPEADLAYLRALPFRHAEGGYLFVHAGIRPRVPLDRQEPHDLMWIREPFLSSADDHGAVIVHGHTPRRAPEVRANRIGIDTGAVMGGQLTCLVLEADRLGFLVA
ncbi:MAG TPA: metallophosphoesterase family protein [Acetobacteraceae bacterium]|nr:metallophosphoesterase family protein [Acetobacteraceae bacterium]